MKIISPSFYSQPTYNAARALLGKELIRIYNNQILSGIIVETEAYGGSDDPASHAYKKLTKRNTPMFGPVGHSYIYFTYGAYHCLNIVARDENQEAGGVLIRSIIPKQGIECMQSFRKQNNIQNLTNGPGKLCQALQLTREHNSIDLTKEGILYIGEGITIKEADIIATPRIGISSAQDRLWRFIVGSDFFTVHKR